MIWCVVPAAGSGQRFGGELPKQYAPLLDQPMLLRTLDRLLAHPRIKGAMVALAADDRYWPGIRELEGKPILTCNGGSERAQSVLNGLDALAQAVGPPSWVLVHDAARPCVRHDDIGRLLERGLSHADGAILAAPVSDTIKRGDDGHGIVESVSRRNLWRALTPQLFRFDDLRSALREALTEPACVAGITDEAAAIERRGGRPLLIAGAADNIKVTTLIDLALAELILTRPQ